jgi:hypothetical protein
VGGEIRMEKKFLNVLIIAVIFCLMLIIPVSAAISLPKSTSSENILFKQVVTPIPTFSYKNVPVIKQQESMAWIQKPINPTVFKIPEFNSNGFQIRSTPLVAPVSDNIKEKPPDSWWLTVIVWNIDHTAPVPDVEVKFEKFSLYMDCKNCPFGNKMGYNIILTPLAAGKTDSNGKITVLLHDTSGYPIYVTASGPVVTENGEQVTYNGFTETTYLGSPTLDITLDSRNLYHPYYNAQ